ncbi:MAG: hypothetical protein IPO19_13735 [Rhodoferax sp.]|nr:hypothetical protein [Rhodoferax sp.]
MTLSSDISRKPGDPGSLLHAGSVHAVSIASIVDEVRHGTGVEYAMASNEIAASNNRPVGPYRATGQFLEQTASSMEQLTSTVKQNPKTARHANQLAASAAGQLQSKAVPSWNRWCRPWA